MPPNVITSKYAAGEKFSADEIQTIITRMAAGCSIHSTALMLGRSAPGVKGVTLRPEVQERIAAEKEELSDLFEQTARRALLALSDEKLEKSSARDLCIIGGIALDKHRLITGQSTQNHLVVHAAAVHSACAAWGEGHVIEAEEASD